jgi:TMEM175 potassium channel family protein
MDEETRISKSRLEFLTDGIFAIVTLLVLEITVPQISSHELGVVGAELPKRLLDLWPKIFSYVISFIILAIYWRGYHRQFHYIKHSDGVLVWTNIMFLMAVTVLPFSTSLLGEYMDQQVSVFIYGGNSIVIVFLLYIQWRYATDHYKLVDKNLDPNIIRRLPRKVFFGILAYLVAMGVSFIIYNTVFSVLLNRIVYGIR